MEAGCSAGCVPHLADVLDNLFPALRLVRRCRSHFCYSFHCSAVAVGERGGRILLSCRFLAGRRIAFGRRRFRVLVTARLFRLFRRLLFPIISLAFLPPGIGPTIYIPLLVYIDIVRLQLFVVNDRRFGIRILTRRRRNVRRNPTGLRMQILPALVHIHIISRALSVVGIDDRPINLQRRRRLRRPIPAISEPSAVRVRFFRSRDPCLPAAGCQPKAESPSSRIRMILRRKSKRARPRHISLAIPWLIPIPRSVHDHAVKRIASQIPRRISHINHRAGVSIDANKNRRINRTRRRDRINVPWNPIRNHPRPIGRRALIPHRVVAAVIKPALGQHRTIRVDGIAALRPLNRLEIWIAVVVHRRLIIVRRIHRRGLRNDRIRHRILGRLRPRHLREHPGLGTVRWNLRKIRRKLPRRHVCPRPSGIRRRIPAPGQEHVRLLQADLKEHV